MQDRFGEGPFSSVLGCLGVEPHVPLRHLPFLLVIPAFPRPAFTYTLEWLAKCWMQRQSDTAGNHLSFKPALARAGEMLFGLFSQPNKGVGQAALGTGDQPTGKVGMNLCPWTWGHSYPGWIGPRQE